MVSLVKMQSTFEYFDHTEMFMLFDTMINQFYVTEQKYGVLTLQKTLKRFTILVKGPHS